MEKLIVHKSSKIAIMFMFLSTAIQAVAGFARDADILSKMALSLLCWGSVAFSLSQYREVKRVLYPKMTKLYGCLMLLVTISILNTLLFGKVYIGNKYFVLLGNMYAALNLVGIFFLSSITTTGEIKYLRNITLAYTFMSIILLVFNYDTTIHSYFLIYPLTYALIFIPYVKVRHKFVIIVAFLLPIFAFIGGARYALLFWAFNILAYIVSKILNKKLTYHISIFCVILPWLLLLYSIHEGQSVFEILSSEISENESLNTDTRTFLYKEIFEDFNAQSMVTLLFGKGAVAYYSSDFFGTNYRLGIEVPMLEWLIQAGILYLIIFTTIVVVAIKSLYKNGNSRFCKITSILIASYYFNCFVSNLNGCNISIMVFWFLIYLSNNKSLMAMEDNEWKMLLRK